MQAPKMKIKTSWSSRRLGLIPVEISVTKSRAGFRGLQDLQEMSAEVWNDGKWYIQVVQS